jgi:hypothetical protein
MNEPTRLIEAGNDDFERELLRSAHTDQPSDRAFRRTLVSIGVGLVVTPAAVASAVPATAAVGTKLGAVVLAKWLFTGVALGVVTAGGVGLSERAFEPAPLTKTHAPATTGAAPAPDEAKAPLAEPARGEPFAESAPADEVSELSPALSEQSVRLRPAASSVVQAPSASPVVAEAEPATSAAVAPSGVSERLAQETRLLDTARGALLRGDAKSALVTLAEYERSFAHGMLAPEARVLCVRALLANGERAAAEALAARIVEAAPDGEHADTVRALLGRASNR